jgi:uncharacterized protein (TIGR00255 family)
MTGYASSFVSEEEFDIELELKSVNSRYFEFKLHGSALPVEWENEIRQQVFSSLKRGKIDLFLQVIEKNARNTRVVVNTDLAKQYFKALVDLARELGIEADVSVRDLLTVGPLLEREKITGDVYLFERIREILADVIHKVEEMMYEEGKKNSGGYSEFSSSHC